MKLLIKLVGIVVFMFFAFLIKGIADEVYAVVCEGCNPNSCCSAGYQCKMLATGCYSCQTDSACGVTPKPTPTPPQANTPTPGEDTGGGGGGGDNVSPTPTPEPSDDGCVPVDCNHEVCGVVLPTITCTSDSDCYGQANKCVGGLCNKCTNPGTACCDGSCRPEGWGCAPAKNCYYTQSCVKQACLGWNGEGCGEYQVQETIACGSECKGVPCKDSEGNDITCGAYLEHPWCDEHSSRRATDSARNLFP